MRYRLINPKPEVMSVLTGLVTLCWLRSLFYRLDESGAHVAIVELMPDWEKAPQEAHTWFAAVDKQELMVS